MEHKAFRCKKENTSTEIRAVFETTTPFQQVLQPTPEDNRINIDQQGECGVANGSYYAWPTLSAIVAQLF